MAGMSTTTRQGSARSSFITAVTNGDRALPPIGWSEMPTWTAGAMLNRNGDQDGGRATARSGSPSPACHNATMRRLARTRAYEAEAPAAAMRKMYPNGWVMPKLAFGADRFWAKVRCPAGHAYDHVTKKGWRKCRTSGRDRARRRLLARGQ